MEAWLATTPWPGVILWIILYISDYYLTLYSARGFREIGHFQFEGSFELRPNIKRTLMLLSQSQDFISLCLSCTARSLFSYGGLHNISSIFNGHTCCISECSSCSRWPFTFAICVMCRLFARSEKTAAWRADPLSKMVYIQIVGP